MALEEDDEHILQSLLFAENCFYPLIDQDENYVSASSIPAYQVPRAVLVCLNKYTTSSAATMIGTFTYLW